MKPAVLALTVALMTAGVAFAADTQNLQRPQQPRQRKSYSLKSSAYFMGRYSKSLRDMIDGALKMDLSAEQRSEVTALTEKYYDPMSKDETEVRKTRMNIPKMLNNPSFDPAKVKEEIGKANALEKKISDSYIDALTSLRGTIGKDNYEKLTKAVYRYRDDLVQMRKKKQSVTRPEGVNKSEPAKTDAPPAAAEKN